MENRAHALTVGLFTLLLGLAVAFAFWWFSGRTERTQDIVLYTDSGVAGLNEQAAVRFRGIRAGRVTDIEFDRRNPRRILVRCRLPADIPLSQATRARLGVQGLTGFVFVELDDDGSNPSAPAERLDGLPLLALQTRAASPTDAALAALERIRDAADRVARLFDESNQQQIRQLLANVERSSAHLEASLARAPALLDRLDRIAARVDSPQLDATLANLERGSAALPAAVTSFRATLANIDALSKRWESLALSLQAGAAGEANQELGSALRDMRRLATDLSQLVNKLERQPQSLLLGSPAPAPGPGEVGYQGQGKTE